MRIRVVLPEPAKPVMIVMGTRDVIFAFLIAKRVSLCFYS